MPEVLTITVMTPAPGGGTSTPQYLTAYVPIANTSASGTCSGTTTVVCNLGSLTNGASAAATFTVQQASARTAAMSVQVSASENDPVLSNNLANSSLTITDGGCAARDSGHFGERCGRGWNRVGGGRDSCGPASKAVTITIN